MTTAGTAPPMLTGCDVLPPMEAGESNHTDTNERKEPKRKPNRRKTADRFAVLNAFVDCTAGTLSRSEMAVWWVLFRDTRDEIAQTSQGEIARRAGISDRTVRRALGRLERRGLLKIVYHGGLNKGPSKYRVFPLEKTDAQRTQ